MEGRMNVCMDGWMGSIYRCYDLDGYLTNIASSTSERGEQQLSSPPPTAGADVEPLCGSIGTSTGEQHRWNSNSRLLK